MPELNKGDLFMIARGHAYGGSGLMGDGVTKYDRSYEGVVFRLEARSGPLLAAVVVHPRSDSYGVKAGDRITVSLLAVLVQPIDEEFLAAIQGEPKPESAIPEDPAEVM